MAVQVCGEPIQINGERVLIAEIHQGELPESAAGENAAPGNTNTNLSSRPAGGGLNQIELGGVDATMLFGRIAVIKEPEGGPNQAEAGENEEWHAPAIEQDHPNHERRRDGSAQARTSVRESLREAAFGGKHPTGERSRGDWERAGFADTEDEADHHHRGGVPGERGEGCEDTPPGDDDRERAARADFVAKPSPGNLEKRETPAKTGQNPASRDEREAEIFADEGHGRRDDGAVHVRDHVDGHRHGEHDVAGAGGAEGVLFRWCFRGGLRRGWHHRRGRSEGASYQTGGA